MKPCIVYAMQVCPVYRKSLAVALSAESLCLFPGSADNRLVVEWISKTGVESGMEMKIKNIGVQ